MLYLNCNVHEIKLSIFHKNAFSTITTFRWIKRLNYFEQKVSYYVGTKCLEYIFALTCVTNFGWQAGCMFQKINFICLKL